MIDSKLTIEVDVLVLGAAETISALEPSKLVHTASNKLLRSETNR